MPGMTTTRLLLDHNDRESGKTVQINKPKLKLAFMMGKVSTSVLGKMNWIHIGRTRLTNGYLMSRK